MLPVTTRQHQSTDDGTTAKKRITPNTVPGGVEDEPPSGGKKSRSNNHAAASNIAPKSFDYMCDDLPVLSLTDEALVEKIRTFVDNKCYPYDKYYSKLKFLSGPVQFAFFEMGWGENSLEHAHLRATGINAVIDVMAERASDNRERSKARCKKKFLSAAATGDEWVIGTAQEAFGLFSNGILQGKCVGCSPKEGRQLFSLCYFLGGVRGEWNHSGKQNSRHSSFHSTVTVSDWAFGFMLLGAHRDSWMLETRQMNPKESRRSRQDQQKCMKEYYDWFAEINRDQNLPGAKNDGDHGSRAKLRESVDSWLQLRSHEFSEAITDNTDAKKPPLAESRRKAVETFDPAIFENMKKVNPQLATITFQSP